MKTLKHKFVELIPDLLEDGVLYISIEYCTAIHKCVCGCGNEVVTPFSPTDWKIIFDGKNISLDPSIGNWNFECKSHYWIKKNKVIWAGKWSSEEIERGRLYDKYLKESFFNQNSSIAYDKSTKLSSNEHKAGGKQSWFRKIFF